MVRSTHRQCSQRVGWAQTPQRDRAVLSITGACERGRWPGSQERWLPAPLRAWGCWWLVPLYPRSPGLQLPPQKPLPSGQQSPKASWEQIPELPTGPEAHGQKRTPQTILEEEQK